MSSSRDSPLREAILASSGSSASGDDDERARRGEGVESQPGQQEARGGAAAADQGEQRGGPERARERGAGDEPSAVPGGFRKDPEQDGDAEERAAEDAGETRVRQRIAEYALLRGAADA